VISNAGAHGRSLSQVLRMATVLCDGQAVRDFKLEDLAMGYRTSIFKGGQRPRDVILSVELDLKVADREELQDEVKRYRARRASTQPTEPSAGSVFKNPPGQGAGRLIEEAGLKGYRIGGAQVSPKHANFIVNLRSATAQEVRALIELIREEVSKRFGVNLELEIELLGEW